jgi:hypothetical protein
MGWLEVVSTQFWVGQMGACSYGDNNYRLKSGHWCIHGLQVREIPPVHYVVLSGGVLWLTGYVP